MARKKYPAIGQVCERRPFRHGDEVFDLSHLDAHIVEYENPNAGPPPHYRFYVTYGFHCFTTSRPDEHSLGDFHAPKESRPFCRTRYQYSKYLPKLVGSLADKHTRCYHMGYRRFATIKLTLENGETIDYAMVFNTFREKKKLRLHVESAYPLTVPLGKKKKIKFIVIAYNTWKGREIKEPQ
jgi:hypothetical protein